jgi:excisionase family DNA binding protein
VPAALTAPELAKLLGIPADELLELAQWHRLPFWTLAGDLFVARCDLAAWLKVRPA